MARILITGSADGLGQMCAKLLLEQGANVVLHARNKERGRDALRKSPGADSVLIGDLSSVEEIKDVAEQANKTGAFDAVVHNAGVYQATSRQIFTVNTLAPYLLTALILKPKRLIYLSSGLHMQGRANAENFRLDPEHVTYSDSKLHMMMLTLIMTRKWPDVYSNAVDPGWVPTKMGGENAPDDLRKGFETQAWLATSNDEKARVSGHYFFHEKVKRHNPLADNEVLQQKLMKALEEITGVSLPD